MPIKMKIFRLKKYNCVLSFALENGWIEGYSLEYTRRGNSKVDPQHNYVCFLGKHGQYDQTFTMTYIQ